MKNKIFILLGTKAQLIKMAPVMKEFQNRSIDYTYISSGQHIETIDNLRANFKIRDSDYLLYRGQDITGIVQMIKWLGFCFINYLRTRKQIFGNNNKGSIMIVHGDTISTLLGAIIGKIQGLKIAHIESGLRSKNLFHPFPEEITRILVFILSDILYCPGQWAVDNLHHFRGIKINTQLNTVYDSVQIALRESNNDQSYSKYLPKEKYILCSIHRFENIFNKIKLEKIISKIIKIGEKIKILFIMHPPTIKQLKKFNFLQKLENSHGIELRPRCDYFVFNYLMHKSEFIISDGGSNQEEAYYIGKACLLMREATERKEGIDSNAILSQYKTKIINSFLNNYNLHNNKREVNKNISPSSIIVHDLLNRMKKYQ